MALKRRLRVNGVDASVYLPVSLKGNSFLPATSTAGSGPGSEGTGVFLNLRWARLFPRPCGTNQRRRAPVRWPERRGF